MRARLRNNDVQLNMDNGGRTAEGRSKCEDEAVAWRVEFSMPGPVVFVGRPWTTAAIRDNVYPSANLFLYVSNH